MRAATIGFIKSNIIYSPESILSSNNYKTIIKIDKSMKISVLTLLSASASPACNGRKNYHKEVNLDYFSEFEIEIMNYLLDKYIKNNLDMKKIIDNICEDSHDDIKAWKVAYDRKKNSGIDYSDTFEDLDKKENNKLYIQEERFLVYRSFKNNIL